jgi:hypothetical protein
MAVQDGLREVILATVQRNLLGMADDGMALIVEPGASLA